MLNMNQFFSSDLHKVQIQLTSLKHKTGRENFFNLHQPMIKSISTHFGDCERPLSPCYLSVTPRCHFLIKVSFIFTLFLLQGGKSHLSTVFSTICYCENHFKVAYVISHQSRPSSVHSATWVLLFRNRPHLE